MSERKKGMLTGLEDNILPFEWIFVIVTNVTFSKKIVEIILFFFPSVFLALVLGFVMATKR